MYTLRQATEADYAFLDYPRSIMMCIILLFQCCIVNVTIRDVLHIFDENAWPACPWELAHLCPLYTDRAIGT